MMTRTAVAPAGLLAAVAAIHPIADAQSGVAQQATERTALPPGWHAQADWSPRSNAAPSLDGVTFVAMDSGYHATTGPAAIFWRPADTASGAYRVVASITQTRNPDHPEAYGVFVGGRDLAGAGQAYTYFLVRAFDGRFSIRRRVGRQTRPTALVDWTAHDVVAKADAASGRATNVLSVVVRGGQVAFSVNGTEVHTVSGLEPAGIVGYRVNHRLDVQLGPLSIQPL
jgi:hypothetical protein